MAIPLGCMNAIGTMGIVMVLLGFMIGFILGSIYLKECKKEIYLDYFVVFVVGGLLGAFAIVLFFL